MPRLERGRASTPTRPTAAGSRGGGDVHVALLRGVNVGGKNLLPMSDLAAMFRAAGCGDVETYIQSGNVVFRAAAALAPRIRSMISKAITARFGISVPVVTRSAAEIAATARNNPFLADGADPKTLHVMFLLDRPGKALVATLDPRRSPPDEFVVRGGEIYLRCPNGVGRSRLTTQYFDSRLATTGTVRNWATVLRLNDMAVAR